MEDSRGIKKIAKEIVMVGWVLVATAAVISGITVLSLLGVSLLLASVNGLPGILGFGILGGGGCLGAAILHLRLARKIRKTGEVQEVPRWMVGIY